MKKILVIQLVLLLLNIYTYATPVSESEAREKAAKFMLSKKGESAARSAQRFGRSGGAGATLTMAEQQEAFYVFNIDSVNGYVIVSGDDRMPDILGYAYYGTYKSEEIPDNMRAWLQGYAEEYQYLQSHSDAKGASLTSVTGGAVLPMLDCKWDQGFPYNSLCPKINGQNTLTGCVATAMAQVMYYHQWPKQTTKTIPAYTARSAGISMPQIEVTTIDWDNMVPSYGNKGGTSAQNQAVAKLMLLCGSAVQMNYGLDGSSAYCNPNVLTEYFGYNKLSVSEVIRGSYKSDIWNQMIYDEVKGGRPVLYSGQSGNGGHQFVIDGYDKNDYFHVNWGWGGSQDNYFLLSSLKEYNSDQSAIIGIKGQGSVGHTYAYAEFVGNTLTFYYDNKRETRTGKMFNVHNHEWTGDEYRNSITAVKFDSSFGNYNYLASTREMFLNMENLTSIQGLEYLNTQNVTDMGGMFWGCQNLTSLDLSNFDTHNVTNMGYMFCACYSLQEIYIGEDWSTQNVTSGDYMFSGCSELIGEKGTQYDYKKFDYTYAHIDGGIDNPGYFSTKGYSYPYALLSKDNKTLTFYYGNGKEVTGSIRIKSYGYYKDRGWDSAAQSLETVVFDESMADCDNISGTADWFYNCENLTTIQGLEYLNTQNVTNMSWMFEGCGSLTSLDLSNFKTQNVTSMGGMFEGCSSLTSLDLSNFKTQNVTSMCGMFKGCKNLTTLDLSNFDTRKVTNMSSMFSGCGSLTSLDVTNFNTQNVTNMDWMFGSCQNLSSLDLSNFNTLNVTFMYGMFKNCNKLTSIQGLEYLNTQNVTDMGDMFFSCGSLTSLDLSNFNTQNVINMYCMFYNCSSLTSLDLSNFNTQNVTDMSWMFGYCSNLTALDVSKFNTRNVADMSYMFCGCYSLQTIYSGEGWNTENVENSNYMFSGCRNLVGQDGTKYNYNFTDKTMAHYGAGGYLTYKSSIRRGDANGDGKVDMDDATFVTNIILGIEDATEAADVNNDGTVNMPDVMFIINYIKNGKFPDKE